ncbi:ribonuclease E inhibitor RraB [Roseovarius sp. SCSIO 43702]|uniref:ribonuclease E inhibitor RraB n=1 Tax=Roseovarius sp. SCSIO 43702 TaxID=2823043 RepID=UPI001C736B84|nr:ribonuclease E inhibitor RraB [Roseovarius sp. SCSIO 43702]QYX57857.1 ribonuclease E inhibitor RraB [Roseovarius sp. SCSIO 43702]
MSGTADDLAAQEAETRAAFAELRAGHDLPDIGDVSYFLLPAGNADDWEPLADALAADGFACEWVPEGEDAPMLVATLPDQILSATAIWIGESVAIAHARDFGFRPDGWAIALDGD